MFDVLLAILHGFSGRGWAEFLIQLKLEPASCVADKLEAGRLNFLQNLRQVHSLCRRSILYDVLLLNPFLAILTMSARNVT